MRKTVLRYLKPVILGKNGTWSPPNGWVARVICGELTHISATGSWLSLREKGASTYAYFLVIPSTVCGAVFDLNVINNTTDVTQVRTARSDHIWFDDRFELVLVGGTGVSIYMLMEVVKVDSITGERLA